MCSIDSNCIFNNSYKNNVDMKANEEPEKIYCIPTEGGCYYITTIKPEPPFAEGVEYTRTDAFIEKVVKYLKDNVTYIHPRKGTKECIVNIPKFIDYMKGE